MNIEDKEYDLATMSIEEITDLATQLNIKLKKCETIVEKAKSVVKSRWADKEISAEVDGQIGHLEIREADDFHPLDGKACFEAMKAAGFEAEFPSICSVNLNDSGKKAKVKSLGITHFLPAVVVDKLRSKKKAKMVTVYFSLKKE